MVLSLSVGTKQSIRNCCSASPEEDESKRVGKTAQRKLSRSKPLERNPGSCNSVLLVKLFICSLLFSVGLSAAHFPADWLPMIGARQPRGLSYWSLQITSILSQNLDLTWYEMLIPQPHKGGSHKKWNKPIHNVVVKWRENVVPAQLPAGPDKFQLIYSHSPTPFLKTKIFWPHS